jgi:hypothetical protein
LRQALAEARSQEAPWLEMIVLTALCERKEATARERESLRRVLGQISGGEDAPPVARARAVVGLRNADDE